MTAISPNLAPRPDDPDWLATLRAFAAERGVTAAATAIGMKRPSVSLALAGAYPGGLDRMAARVRASLMHRVRCPYVGEDIATDECRDWALRPFSAASARSAALYRACRACPNRPRQEVDRDQ